MEQVRETVEKVINTRVNGNKVVVIHVRKRLTVMMTFVEDLGGAVRTLHFLRVDVAKLC